MTTEVENFATQVSDFSLRGLEGLTTEYIPPPIGRFNPEGSWRLSYAMFVLVPRGAQQKGGS